MAAKREDMSTDKISAVICTKNRPQDIIRCIDSLLIQTLLPDEIVIIDSGDTDELKARLDSFGDKITINYIYAKANLTQARNIGIDNSIGDIIAFLDDDTILDKDCLKEIKYVFSNDPEGRVGGVTGEEILEEANFITRILSPGARIFARVFLLNRYGDGRFQPSGLSTTIKSGTVDKPTPIEYMCGANMSFRREVINEMRFDEESPHLEDDDIGYRVSRRYQNMYAPRVRYVHNAAPLGGYGTGRGILRIIKDIDGYRYYFKKNLPQTFKHKLAFYWSLIGLFIRGIIRVTLGSISMGKI